jgi:hypothetical protein
MYFDSNIPGIIRAPTPTRVQRKLLNFRTLQKGWHYGEGGPISETVVQFAEMLYRYCVSIGFTNMNAFPGADGEILLTIYAKEYRRGRIDNHYIELLLEDDKHVTMVHERNKTQELVLERIEDREIKTQLKKIRDEIWNISGSSMLRIMIHRGVSSEVLLSSAPQGGWVAVYLSSSTSASTRLGTPYASTSENFIQPQRVSRQSIGSSMKASSHQDTV